LARSRQNVTDTLNARLNAPVGGFPDGPLWSLWKFPNNNRRSNMKLHYIRSGKQYNPEEILKLIENKKYPYKVKRVELDGDLINIRSKRLFTFKNYGIICACCGIKGQYFVKEKHRNTRRENERKYFHLNLYGIDGNGKEILMTSDHKIPLGVGGKNGSSNRQTMCERCNHFKGDRKISNEELILEIIVAS
jgi:hypothetical protein